MKYCSKKRGLTDLVQEPPELFSLRRSEVRGELGSYDVELDFGVVGGSRTGLGEPCQHGTTVAGVAQPSHQLFLLEAINQLCNVGCSTALPVCQCLEGQGSIRITELGKNLVPGEGEAQRLERLVYLPKPEVRRLEKVAQAGWAGC